MNDEIRIELVKAAVTAAVELARGKSDILNATASAIGNKHELPPFNKLFDHIYTHLESKFHVDQGV